MSHFIPIQHDVIVFILVISNIQQLLSTFFNILNCIKPNHFSKILSPIKPKVSKIFFLTDFIKNHPPKPFPTKLIGPCKLQL